jgi:hypothetical protein
MRKYAQPEDLSQELVLAGPCRQSCFLGHKNVKVTLTKLCIGFTLVHINFCSNLHGSHNSF